MKSPKQERTSNEVEVSAPAPHSTERTSNRRRKIGAAVFAIVAGVGAIAGVVASAGGDKSSANKPAATAPGHIPPRLHHTAPTSETPTSSTTIPNKPETPNGSVSSDLCNVIPQSVVAQALNLSEYNPANYQQGEIPCVVPKVGVNGAPTSLYKSIAIWGGPKNSANDYLEVTVQSNNLPGGISLFESTESEQEDPLNKIPVDGYEGFYANETEVIQVGADLMNVQLNQPNFNVPPEQLETTMAEAVIQYGFSAHPSS